MKRVFVILLAMLLCVTAAFSVVAAGAAADLPAPNECERHEVCTALSAQAQAYYTGEYSFIKLSALSGASNTDTSYFATLHNPLYEKLHSLMADTHTYYTSYSGYKAGSLAYYWVSTDAVESCATYTMFYSDVPGDTAGISLNREHIWPKSRASFHQKNGGSDLHHLRPAVSTVNNAKSDHLFGYIDGAYADGFKQGMLFDNLCYYVYSSEDLFECKDDVKGDVARILLYVYCRWGQPNLYTDMTADLPPLDPDDDKNSGQKAIESLDTLLQWCETDPVDSWEMRRNDLIQQVQGNRNVFIDYPELAWQMFGRAVPDSMTTPTHMGCEHQYTEFIREEASCTKDGEFILKCGKCGKCGNTLERKIACLRHIDANKDGVCDRCKKQYVALILGDADADGEVTLIDNTVIQRYLAALTDEEQISMKASQIRDVGLEIIDATYLGRYLALMETPFAIGKVI